MDSHRAGTLVVVKANIPAGVCFVALVYCCWALCQSNRQSILEDPRTTVEITVHAPDGSIIPAVGPADQPLPKTDSPPSK